MDNKSILRRPPINQFTLFSHYIQHFWKFAGPSALLGVWGASVFLAWAAAGRHAGLLDWGLAFGLLTAAVGAFVLFVGMARLRRLRARHADYDHAGTSDVSQLSKVEREVFCGTHLLVSSLCVCGGLLVSLSLRGLPISALFVAVVLVPGAVLLWRSFGLNGGDHVAVGLFVAITLKRARTGQDAVYDLRHQSRIDVGLATAHSLEDNGAIAREILAILRHEGALWPSLDATVALAPISQMRWRLDALAGLTWHMISAGLVAWFLAFVAPIEFLDPLPSPLALLRGEDAQSLPENPPTEEEKETAQDEILDDGETSGNDGATGESESLDGSKGEPGGGDSKSDGDAGRSGGGSTEGDGEGPTAPDSEGSAGENPTEGEGSNQPSESDGKGEFSEKGDDGADRAGDASGTGEEPSAKEPVDTGQDAVGGASDRPGEAETEPSVLPDTTESEEKVQADQGSEGQGTQGELSVEMTEPDGTAGEAGLSKGETTIMDETRVSGAGSEAPEEEVGPIVGQEGDTSEGDPEGISSATVASGDEGALAQEGAQADIEHPFAAHGEAPKGVTILQDNLLDYPDNLPIPQPPSQRLPAWVLELELELEK